MGGPATWIGVWEPEGDDESLVRACAASLARAGALAEISWRDEQIIALCTGAPGWVIDPAEHVTVEPGRSRPGSGGLVQLVADTYLYDETPGLEPAEGWARLRDAVARLAGEVRPLIVTSVLEFPVDELDNPPMESAEFLFATCWVNPERLEPERREALEVVTRGLRTEVAGGWWWSIFEPMDFGEHPVGEDWRQLTREIWAAWMDQPVPEPDPEDWEELPSTAPVPPALRFWDCRRDDETMRRDAASWAAGRVTSAEVTMQEWTEPGWTTIYLSLEGVAEADQLGFLRSAAASLAPSWLALGEPHRNVFDGEMEFPAMSQAEDVWVRCDWIGAERLARLDEVLAGAYREEHAEGVLYVTTPERVPDGQVADWCRDADERWDRQVAAATILGEAALATREHVSLEPEAGLS